jgi:hypothetical protein
MLLMILNSIMITILGKSLGTAKGIDSFEHKIYMIDYCSRFQIAFLDLQYGEILLHPPPLNLFTIPIFVVAIFDKGYSLRMFSILSYWIENIIFILVFLIFEIMIWPLVFVKVIVNICICTPDIL